MQKLSKLPQFFRKAKEKLKEKETKERLIKIGTTIVKISLGCGVWIIVSRVLADEPLNNVPDLKEIKEAVKATTAVKKATRAATKAAKKTSKKKILLKTLHTGERIPQPKDLAKVVRKKFPLSSLAAVLAKSSTQSNMDPRLKIGLMIGAGAILGVGVTYEYLRHTESKYRY